MTDAVQRRKVEFPLKQDEDGYPPFRWEGLWAEATGEGTWQLDNIPFFVHEVSNRDIVAAAERDGRLVFDRVVRRNGHSTLRLIFEDLDTIAPVRAELQRLGCSSEGAHLKRLVAVDVPPNVSLSDLRIWLERQAALNGLEYEDACDQHQDADP